MAPDHDNDKNREIEKEILQGQKSSLAAAIAREGGSFFKGESIVPKLVQATIEINLFIDAHVCDSSGALKAALLNLVEMEKTQVSRHMGSPLTALQEMLEAIIGNQQLLYDLVRQVDIKWGQIYGERPHFQQPGHAPHLDDEYTHESVRKQLLDLLDKVIAARRQN
ncbi:hypothetical protein [Gloeobacter violaceus]|uniref:Glr3346 protein n=1 Tax=Gloeobacter violaceus (strain ATCC 29082 / PCC 7421) TaxID=251221 RepID=Q7NG27_GLOVI|nr:hypothetical protein [Gloeobacter violaceus]BAC91287.1 glr3346 [Gloeobacter violaceus PCC 7421]